MKPIVTRVQEAASVSRRFLLSAPALLAVPAAAVQEQPAPDIQQAREQAARNADTLIRFNLPRTVEPAFRFEA